MSWTAQVFLQWKGTDACFDFTCECGLTEHFDADFAYYVKCLCGRTWEMPQVLLAREVDPTDIVDSEHVTVVMGDLEDGR